MTYSNWETKIAELLSQGLECSYSDAQAVIEANDFIMAQSWGLDLAPQQVAEKLMK